MRKTKTGIIYGSWIMFKRNLLIAIRHPEAIIMAVVTPFLLMFLFGTVFGSIVDLGEINYLDFIIPGVLIQCMAQASVHTAMNVATDMTKGIIDRFRSMSISRFSVLIGHIGVGLVRNFIVAAVIIASGFMLGFKPESSLMDWLAIIGILMLINFAISSIALFVGLISKTPESSNGLMFPFFVLPFMSSGFIPVENLDGGMKWFAENQPMTPMIDSMRSFLTDSPLGDSLWITLAWCVGIVLVTFIASMQIYKKKVS